MRNWVAAIVLLSFAVLSGCNQTQHQLAAAKQSECSRHYADALRIYSRLLDVDQDKALRAAIRTLAADDLINLERYQEAYEELRQALTEDPDSNVARVSMSNLLVSGGEYKEAQVLLQSALAHDSHDEAAIIALSSLERSGGNSASAEQLYLSALAHHPASAELAMGYAQLLTDALRSDEARAVLSDAALQCAGQPEKSSKIWLAIARLEEQQGNLSSAEADYRRAQQELPSEQTALRRAQFYERNARMDEARSVLRGLPSASSTQRIGELELASGNSSGAASQFLNPAVSRESGSNKARLLEADLQAGRVAHVRMLWNTYRSSFDEAAAKILESEIAAAEGDLTGANVFADGALRLAPNSVAAQFQLAQVMRAKQNIPGAEIALSHALELDENYVPAALALATIHQEKGEVAFAEQLAVRVLQQEPANLDALAIYARTLTAARRFASAHQIVARAVAVNPGASTTHVAAAELAAGEGDVQRALKEFQLALTVDPNDTVALDGLTQLYQQGSVSRVMIRNLEAIATQPPRSEALLQLAARLYAARGAYSDARRCLSKGNASLFHAHDLELSGRLTEAALQYEAVLKTGENSRDNTGIAANNLAWIYLQQEKLDRALELSETAQKLRPGDPSVIDTAGLVHLHRREYADAVRLLHQALLIAETGHSESRVIAAIRGHLRQAQQSHTGSSS